MSPALNSPRLTYVRSTDGRSAAVAQGRESSKETGGDDSKPRRTVALIMYQRVQKHRINFNNLQNFSINPPWLLQKMTCEIKNLYPGLSSDRVLKVHPEMDSYTFSVLSNGLISYKWGIFMNNWRYLYQKKHTLFRFGQNWQS